MHRTGLRVDLLVVVSIVAIGVLVAGATHDSAPIDQYASGSSETAFPTTELDPATAARALSELPNVPGAHDFDWSPDLSNGIAAMESQQQRELARWAAARAFEFAGLANRSWVVPALTALSKGQPLPAPFNDPSAATRRLIEEDLPAEGNGGPFIPLGTAASGHPSQAAELFNTGPIDRPFYALPALFSALDPNPLLAAFQALSHACGTYGGYVDILLSEVRRDFGL